MSLLSVIAILLAGFSVTFTKKLKRNFELKYKVDGGDLMNYLVMVTSSLAGSTGACGVCSSYKEGERYKSITY